MSYPTEYAHVQAALERAESAAGAAEGHGMLCGMLCAGGRSGRDRWIDEVLGGSPPGTNLLASEARALLAQLYAETQQRLHDDEFGFELLLPEDVQPVQTRADALSEWCQGFVLGFSAGGISDSSRLPADVGELLRDFTEITRVEADPDADANDEEGSYVEIVEYVRMGVLLIYEELHPVQGGPGLQ